MRIVSLTSVRVEWPDIWRWRVRYAVAGTERFRDFKTEEAALKFIARAKI